MLTEIKECHYVNVIQDILMMELNVLNVVISAKNV